MLPGLPPMPADQADWIGHNVLTQTYLKSVGAHLVRLCSCQYGICGWCKDWESHDRCTSRSFGSIRHRRWHTSIVARGGQGWAMATVYLSGRNCGWYCSCLICHERDTGGRCTTCHPDTVQPGQQAIPVPAAFTERQPRTRTPSTAGTRPAEAPPALF